MSSGLWRGITEVWRGISQWTKLEIGNGDWILIDEAHGTGKLVNPEYIFFLFKFVDAKYLIFPLKQNKE